MVYLGGLQAAICILVYDTPQFASWFMWRMRSPSLWVRLLTQLGLCQRHREPVQGRRAMMKKLIIHLLFRTVNGYRLLASSLAIIWLTANVFFFLTRKPLQEYTSVWSDRIARSRHFVEKAELQVGGLHWDPREPSLFQRWKQMALFAAVITLPGNTSFSMAS